DLWAGRLGDCGVILGTRAGDRGVVAAKVTTPKLNAGELVREAAKRLANLLAERLGDCGVILGTRAGDRGVVVAKVTTPKLNAGELVREAAKALGGKGGGRPGFAQGGGPDASKLPAAIERALSKAREALSG
ncbi:hypothetical protein DRJ54_06555, partial [Candidatus Acetothermia bacterium]